ncbi:MAG: hypothetical protein PHQ83_04020 [Eubacteriales bacterium]|nr:hypothetical protein [Eubacteriales bacterium]
MVESSGQIMLLTDPRGWFWKKYNNRNQTESLDLTQIEDHLVTAGFQVEIANIAKLDWTRNYRGMHILYTSSEDFNGGTKSFVEDVLLWLEKQGSILVPSYHYLRAHHNKVMMELLRHSFLDSEMKTIQSRIFPSCKMALEHPFALPIVVKSASGAGSHGVALAKTKKQFIRVVRSFSRLAGWDFAALFKIRNFLRAFKRQGPVNYHNEKFVIQNFVPDLSGDYKVLVFNDHYFVLHRKNRQNDFRASGSGQFIAIPSEEIQGVLNFARKCQTAIRVPFLSLDIGFDGRSHHLIEFQCVSFGLKALTLSTGYYESSDNGIWQFVEKQSLAESEFSRALIVYLQMIK